jgi:hypothetical protein
MNDYQTEPGTPEPQVTPEAEEYPKFDFPEIKEGDGLSLDIFREVALRRVRSARVSLDTELQWAWEIIAEAQGKGINLEESPWPEYRRELRKLQDTKPGN